VGFSGGGEAPGFSQMTSELVLGRRSYSLRARAKSTQRWNRDPGFLASAIDSVGSRHDFLEYFSAERISNGRALKSSSPWSRTARGNGLRSFSNHWLRLL
jgi:hypothetical protein